MCELHGSQAILALFESKQTARNARPDRHRICNCMQVCNPVGLFLTGRTRLWVVISVQLASLVIRLCIKLGLSRREGFPERRPLA